ncbi:hypothetical protein C8Q76DRAFT_149483 [Earliella scabrosa]|nr:hypothetical protein C8Q76DRAFT_149483 [Earliella scabrosa]
MHACQWPPHAQPLALPRQPEYRRGSPPASRPCTPSSCIQYSELPLASCVSSIACNLLTTVYRPPRLCPRRASAHRSPAPSAPFLRAHARTVRTRSVLAPAIASRLETFGPAPHRSQDPPARAGAAHGLGRSRAYITLSSFSLSRSLAAQPALLRRCQSKLISPPLSRRLLAARRAYILESLPCCCSWQPGPSFSSFSTCSPGHSAHAPGLPLSRRDIPTSRETPL